MALSFTFFALLQRHTTPTLTLQQRTPPVDSTPHADSMLPAPVPEGSLSPVPASNLVVYLLLYHQHPARPPIVFTHLNPIIVHHCRPLAHSSAELHLTRNNHSSCHITMVLLFIVLRGPVIITTASALFSLQPTRAGFGPSPGRPPELLASPSSAA